MKPLQCIRVIVPDSVPEFNRPSLRIKYDPEWSKTLPYCTYRGGTASRQFSHVEEAKQYLDPDGKYQWSDPY